MANVEKLLRNSGEGVDLLTRLELLPEEQKLLKSAKTKIRDQLRAAIGEATRSRLGRTITPRFFTQGSDKYKTLNRPAWMPPQRKDLDDGVYLPMTFMQNARPSQAADIFFAIVDAALEQLIKREGWKGFERKPTCARVILDDGSHVDVPLYAIPDDEFGRLEKAEALMAADSADWFMRSRMDRRNSWDLLPSDKVLLAHREEGWKPSDPRQVHEWFLGGVKDYGEDLRRQSRYLKAWRDHHQLDHISSIILMVCAWNVFRELGQSLVPSRDDLMLAKITERLPDLFAAEIENPTDRAEKLCRKWSAEERTKAIRAAASMHEEVDMAVHHCYIATSAVARISDGVRPADSRSFRSRQREGGGSGGNRGGSRHVLARPRRRSVEERMNERDARQAVADALRQRGFDQDFSHPAHPTFRGRLDPTGLNIPVSIEVPDFDFVTAPVVRIEPGGISASTVIPHVSGGDDQLCYLDVGSTVLDRYDPGGTVLRCLLRAEQVLGDAVRGKLNDDFADEYANYWSAKTLLVDLPPDTIGEAEISWVSLDRRDLAGTPILARKGKLARSFRDAHERARGPGAKPSSEACWVVGVDAPLGFDPKASVPPRDLAGLLAFLTACGTGDGVVDEALKRGEGLSRWIAISRTKRVLSGASNDPEEIRQGRVHEIEEAEPSSHGSSGGIRNSARSMARLSDRRRFSLRA